MSPASFYSKTALAGENLSREGCRACSRLPQSFEELAPLRGTSGPRDRSVDCLSLVLAETNLVCCGAVCVARRCAQLLTDTVQLPQDLMPQRRFWDRRSGRASIRERLCADLPRDGAHRVERRHVFDLRRCSSRTSVPTGTWYGTFSANALLVRRPVRVSSRLHASGVCS